MFIQAGLMDCFIHVTLPEMLRDIFGLLPAVNGTDEPTQIEILFRNSHDR